MRVLVYDALRDDSFVRLAYNSNQEVQKDDQIEELIEEPECPDEVNHDHWVVKYRCLTMVDNFVNVLPIFVLRRCNIAD